MLEARKIYLFVSKNIQSLKILDKLYPTNIEKTVQIKHNNIANQDSELSN